MAGRNWNATYDRMRLSGNKKCIHKFNDFKSITDIDVQPVNWIRNCAVSHTTYEYYCNLCGGYLHHNTYRAIKRKFKGVV